MGLASSKTLAKEYMPVRLVFRVYEPIKKLFINVSFLLQSSNILMIASMTLAAAAEHTNLHRRIAILCLRCMGFDARL